MKIGKRERYLLSYLIFSFILSKIQMYRIEDSFDNNKEITILWEREYNDDFFLYIKYLYSSQI